MFKMTEFKGQGISEGTVQINFSSDLKIFVNSQPSASITRIFFLTVSQNNFGNKIPITTVPFPFPLRLPDWLWSLGPLL
jgi:hypothetical protein